MSDRKEHSFATLERIRIAREHYQTRAERRPKGLSRDDVTLYDVLGRRRSGELTLDLRVLCVQAREALHA